MMDIEIRLLRVFKAVVEAGGFSDAQAVLNVGASTISMQMAQLEARLGYVVCHRGRSGFRLTDKGEVFYRLVVEFFQSMQSFELQADELRVDLSGQLRLGFLDNIVADQNCPLRSAITAFQSKHRNGARIVPDVYSQQDLDRALLENKIDLAIGIFYSRMAGIRYESLYLQRDILVCKKGHPLANIVDQDELSKALPAANKVRRSFIGVQEFPLYDARTLVSTIGHIEAATLLILSGDCVGYLPRHYAAPWVASGELIELMPDVLFLDTQVSIAIRQHSVASRSTLNQFLACLRDASPALKKTA
jgi:LysR family transcriptional regulator, transcriptional activator for bauABCD operon